ncbi:hypothetical protein SteCoe_6000 [Stentor coeruleus]|uniref:LITAF domain-containing protein n=1 Tax=Stentor coeruleus TaxID=5963 RepID=A0A1R2CQZ6_9CILI|nr:hypothetical protein SteCoe_6000 [Stentor coeruleus]
MSEINKTEYPPAYDPEITSTAPPLRNEYRNENQPYYGYQEESVGTVPRQFYCPNCNRFNWSKVSNKPGLFTWLLCTYLCLIGCWLCCYLPFCVKKCQDTVHTCAACDENLAIVTPI